MCREGSRRSRSRWVISVSERGMEWEGTRGMGDKEGDLFTLRGER